MQDPERSRPSFARETLLPMLIVALIAIPLRSAVADWNDVPSGSMRPTILEGDRIWVDKLAYGLRLPLTLRWIARWDEPARGDVVTLVSPSDGRRLVKRVIGLPGDRVSMSANRLTINGHALGYSDPRTRAATDLDDANDADVREQTAILRNEALGDRRHAIATIPTLAGRIDSFREFVVPKGHFFFLGDNRDHSQDSRFVGPVALDQIYGRVTHIALSADPDHHYRPRFERFFKPIDDPAEPREREGHPGHRVREHSPCARPPT